MPTSAKDAHAWQHCGHDEHQEVRDNLTGLQCLNQIGGRKGPCEIFPPPCFKLRAGKAQRKKPAMLATQERSVEFLSVLRRAPLCSGASRERNWRRRSGVASAMMNCLVGDRLRGQQCLRHRAAGNRRRNQKTIPDHCVRASYCLAADGNSSGAAMP